MDFTNLREHYENFFLHGKQWLFSTYIHTVQDEINRILVEQTATLESYRIFTLNT